MKEPVFDSWRDQPLDEVLFQCRELYENIDFPTVAKWRDQGGKVLGHFQVYFPEEIVHAAGMLPVKIHGGNIQPDQADSRFGSYLCSIIKTSLEFALSGKVKLDAFVTHPICDAARNLGAIWGRNYDYPCEILYLPQNPNSVSSIPYLRGEYGRLKRMVEKVSGAEITEEALRNSIQVFNQNRRLLRELYEIKRDNPEKIAAEDAYALVALAGIMPREEHNELLEYALPLIRTVETKREDRIRVVFEGAFCEQPPLNLIKSIELSGCYIVDDDYMLITRWLKKQVPVEGDPLANLAEAFIKYSTETSSKYVPNQDDKGRFLVDAVKDRGAEGVIFAAPSFCDPALLDRPMLANALNRAGIPNISFKYAENSGQMQPIREQAGTFADTIKLWSEAS